MMVVLSEYSKKSLDLGVLKRVFMMILQLQTFAYSYIISTNYRTDQY